MARTHSLIRAGLVRTPPVLLHRRLVEYIRVVAPEFALAGGDWEPGELDAFVAAHFAKVLRRELEDGRRKRTLASGMRRRLRSLSSGWSGSRSSFSTPVG